MKLSEIKVNPKNPRFIKDDRFKNLVKSIEEFPKMMELRPIVVDNDMNILGGNMRFKACEELRFTEIPDSWVKKASELTEEEMHRFIIADNIQHGDWDFDILANEWDEERLNDWGIDISFLDTKIPNESEFDENIETKNECPSCGYKW